MAYKEYIKNKQGTVVYPVTKEEAVIDNSGVTLDVKLATITGGMDILELSSGSGILSNEQLSLVQSDHCIIKYEGFYYYKNTHGETTCTYNRVSEEKGERTTTDYYFTCTLSSGVFTFGSNVTPQGSPDAVKYVEQTLTSAQKEQARDNIGAGTYSKPVGGIPASDLASGAIPEQIQSDWDQTDTTAKDYIKNKPNIPSAVSDVVKYTPQTLSSAQQEQARTNIGAGTYNKPSSGIPASDIANGVIPDISGKQDTLVSGTNIKTVNQNSLLGSGDITIQDGEDGVGFETISTPQTADGTALITLTNGDTITLDLNHQHPQYPKYVYCATQAAYDAITTKESDTLYLILETS